MTFTFKRAGNQLPANGSFTERMHAAGLGFTVEAAPLYYYPNKGEMLEVSSRQAIIRTDTGADLGLVGKRYKIVQPSQIMEFFEELSDKGGFKFEAAGTFRHGAKIFGLARVGEESKIIGTDSVWPYLLVATSYDGSLATTGRLTAVRPYCENSLTMALHGEQGGNRVRVPHSVLFDAKNVRSQLGIALDSWEGFIGDVRRMAEKPMSGPRADQFLVDLLKTNKKEEEDVRESTTYRNLMSLFEGKDLIGAELIGGRTEWAMLNAVTQYADHSKGAAGKRLEESLLGSGDALKSKAFGLLAAA